MNIKNGYMIEHKQREQDQQQAKSVANKKEKPKELMEEKTNSIKQLAQQHRICHKCHKKKRPE